MSARRMLPHELEVTVQARCEHLLAMGDWLWFHRSDTPRTRPEQRGLPDLIAIHACGRLLFIEAKSARGHLRPEQEQWQERLWRGSHETYVWSPADLDDIAETLRCDCGSIPHVKSAS